MKCLRHILGLGLLLAMMVNCGNSPDTSAMTGTPSQSGTAALEALKEIDSLMWKQPDSALTVMLEFAASPEADSLDEFEEHYCQMLISELLYKNDYKQSNREELLKAVVYFDSIVAADGYKTDSRRDAPRASAKNVQNIAFLDARTHYINGVGFYEKDSVVEACGEYLRTLEVMEEHFEERALTGKRAVFMFYTYNRLLELFSAQFMMDPAITCGEQVLYYCQKEASLSNQIPITFLFIGKQYDKNGKKVDARQYYVRAIEMLQDSNNVVFRDAVSLKALCDYQLGLGIDQPMNTLKQILSFSETETERLNRFQTIGFIFFEEGMFDSALVYLEPAFIGYENNPYRVKYAEYLRIIYDNLENKEKSDAYVKFIADHRKSEGENKTLISKLEAMFKTYMDQKQQKEAEEAREKSIRKTIVIIVPIAIVVALTIILLAKLKSKKLLKEQQEEADRRFGVTEQEHKNELRRLQAEAEQRLTDAERKHQQKVEEILKRHEEELKLQKDQSEQEIAQTRKRHEEELETERLSYENEQDTLRQNLMEREREVRALEKALNQQREEVAKQREAFLNETICQYILDLVHGKHITSRDTYSQHDIGLKAEDFKQLKDAVERHYKGFDNMLLGQCASLKQSDLSLCHLHLLGLNEGEIGALKGRTYSGVKKHVERLQEKLGLDESVTNYVMRAAEGLCVPQDVPQSVSQDGSLEIAQIIQDIVSNNPKITREEMAHQLGVSSKTIGRYLKKLDGRVRYVGSGYSGHWEVTK